jgi:hypothetical protein
MERTSSATVERRNSVIDVIKEGKSKLDDFRKQPSILWHAISGTIGSLIAEMVLFPVDTIKLHVQTAAAGDANGFVATLIRIIKERGLRGLYGGLTGAMIKESIHSMNFWIFHGWLFKYIAKSDDGCSKTRPTVRLLLNMLAKQLNWLCTVPFEAVSTVNQLAATNPGFFRTAWTMYNDHGIAVFYRGLSVSLVLAINPAIMNTLITTFLRLNQKIREARGEDREDAREHSATAVGISTGLAKVVATSLTYPLIRAKVILQTTTNATTLMTVLRDEFAAEGVLGLYRGVVAMSYKTVLWNSLMMAVKHVLTPKRAPTPPGSPAPPPLSLSGLSRMPLMAREPFPVELVTVEKLNEILIHLKMKEHSSNQSRIVELEDGLKTATSEIREVKSLLRELVATTEQIARNSSEKDKDTNGGVGGRRVSFHAPASVA